MSKKTFSKDEESKHMAPAQGKSTATVLGKCLRLLQTKRSRLLKVNW